jgi:IS30 family transposase
LKREPSTISREIARNGGRTRYRPVCAERRAWRCAKRPKRAKLQQSPTLRRLVELQLRARWSPEQIAGWLKRAFPDFPEWHVSHETIYQSLFVQTRGALKRELTRYLRTQRATRRSVSTRPDGRGQLRDTISIAERPPEVADRAVPGHWEGDLLLGGATSQIITLVERLSRFVLLLRAPHRDATTVASILTRQVQRLPDGLMASLTWDQGKEMALNQFSRACRCRSVSTAFPGSTSSTTPLPALASPA